MSSGGSGRFTRAGYVICSACQAENLAGNRFCDRCGTRIGVSTRSPLLKPDAAPPLRPSYPPDEAGAPSTTQPAPEVTTVTSPVLPTVAPTDDAAPPLVDLAPAPGPGGTPETAAGAKLPETGALPTLVPKGTGAPAERSTPSRPAGSDPRAGAGPARRAPNSTDVAANDGAAMETALVRGATDSNRPVAILLGITGTLLAICVALWVLLVLLGAIDFTVRGASFATSVATIVATRAP